MILEHEFLDKPKRVTLWRLWAKALGEKATPCDRESDRVALIRTLFIVQAVIANIFLIANAIHHW